MDWKLRSLVAATVVLFGAPAQADPLEVAIGALVATEAQRVAERFAQTYQARYIEGLAAVPGTPRWRLACLQEVDPLHVLSLAAAIYPDYSVREAVTLTLGGTCKRIPGVATAER